MFLSLKQNRNQRNQLCIVVIFIMHLGEKSLANIILSCRLQHRKIQMDTNSGKEHT